MNVLTWFLANMTCWIGIGCIIGFYLDLGLKILKWLEIDFSIRIKVVLTKWT